jgi:hypothetical protein
VVTARITQTTGLIALLACACASADSGGQPWQSPASLDKHDVPEATRPGYGNTELHTWWPVTDAEVAALKGVEQARQGDPHALLALAVLASGDVRDAASYARFQQRVDDFVVQVKPAVDRAGDLWHRGYELNRAMHRVFFKGAQGDLGGYEFYQSRVTRIFSDGRYNCLSSAMLFAVLARDFGLPVRAAVVPTHVFIDLGDAGGKTIEVETTSATGFDWVHDARFYKEEAGSWSSRRGLRPVTLEEYQRRTLMEPYRLMANAMRNQHPGESEQDRGRLDELAALVDPDDPELQRVRIQTYANEAYQLHESRSWRTMVRLFDVIGPAVGAIAATSKDPKTLETIAWLGFYQAYALMVVHRDDEAMAIMTRSWEHLDAGWPEADKLRTNFLSVLNNRLCDLIDKHDYPTAVTVFQSHREACRAQKICAGNASISYRNWSIDHLNAGDWQSARQVLQQCVSELPDDPACRDTLTDLESRHRF